MLQGQEEEFGSHFTFSKEASDWCCPKQGHNSLLRMPASTLKGLQPEPILDIQAFLFSKVIRQMWMTMRVPAGFLVELGYWFVLLVIALICCVPAFPVLSCALQWTRAGLVHSKRKAAAWAASPSTPCLRHFVSQAVYSFSSSVSLLLSLPFSPLCWLSSSRYLSLFSPSAVPIPFLSFLVLLCFAFGRVLGVLWTVCMNQYCSITSGLLLSLSINFFLSPSGWFYLFYNQGRPELAAMNVRKSL